MNHDFYIGHLPRSPDRLARHVRCVVAGTVLVALALIVGVAARQTPAEPGSFEFGIERDFEGVLRGSPLPILRSVSASGAVTNYLLVGEGKHGLPAFAQGHDGERVRFRGSLIQKEPSVMVEMNDAKSFTALGPATASDAPEKTEPLGRVVLTGELVDTKCYFGVMRPATGKVHRACAVRCLSGGVPPGLLVRDGHGGGVVVMLTGSGGGPLRLDPQWAARSLRATGDLSLREGIPVLETTGLALDPGLR